ncbi:MAG TPA: hypothetical protein VHN80_29375, partial [Kineosporiaceae bacterium]|nr:hypothetical protein [Kineosporiaceae bacterium]
DDGQMLAANVEVTRALLGCVGYERVDWDTIEDLLTDPARPVAGSPLAVRGRPAEISALSAHIRGLIEQYRQGERLVGWPRLLRALALMCQSNWWGTPWWLDTVEEWITQAAGRIRSSAPAGWRNVECLKEALVDAPEALPAEVRTWCVHQELGHARGRQRYRARLGLRGTPGDPHPGDRPWSQVIGLYGVMAPMPAAWSYAISDRARYRPGAPARSAARQVSTRGERISVWVNQLTRSGVDRLLELAEIGRQVYLNGNPLPAYRNQPAFLGAGRVTAVGSGWVAIDVEEQSRVARFTAVVATSDTDPWQIRALIGPVDGDGRYRARVWIAREASSVVVATHWPDEAELAEALQ